jgi:hypothetical protein
MMKYLFIPFILIAFSTYAQNDISKQSTKTDIVLNEINTITLDPIPLKRITDEDIMILSTKKVITILTTLNEETKMVNLTNSLQHIDSKEFDRMSKHRKEVIVLKDIETVPIVIELKAKLITME